MRSAKSKVERGEKTLRKAWDIARKQLVTKERVLDGREFKELWDWFLNSKRNEFSDAIQGEMDYLNSGAPQIRGSAAAHKVVAEYVEAITAAIVAEAARRALARSAEVRP